MRAREQQRKKRHVSALFKTKLVAWPDAKLRPAMRRAFSVVIVVVMVVCGSVRETARTGERGWRGGGGVLRDAGAHAVDRWVALVKTRQFYQQLIRRGNE